MFGEEVEKTVPGTPRVILALANHAQTAGRDRANVLQRAMFKAAAGSGLEMKFAFYGADNAAGVRRCRITTRWITDPDDMAAVMDRAECSCGCYVNIRDVLAQSVKEAEERPLRAVIIVGDAVRSEDTGTATLGDVGGGVGLCRGRRGGREDDGGPSGDPAAATSQAGGDANHRGARSRSGGHQEMTALGLDANPRLRRGDIGPTEYRACFTKVRPKYLRAENPIYSLMGAGAMSARKRRIGEISENSEASKAVNA